MEWSVVKGGCIDNNKELPLFFFKVGGGLDYQVLSEFEIAFWILCVFREKWGLDEVGSQLY